MISYCNKKEIPLFVCYLDASRAFDCVQHEPLIKKLLVCGFPVQLVELFLFWFTNQKFVIRWGKIWSASIPVPTGVRQGGILSPYLFAVYVDDLSRKLNDSKLGFNLLGKMVNHIMYQDDLVLLATSRSSLEKMLEMCSDYAQAHCLPFNLQKLELQL